MKKIGSIVVIILLVVGLLWASKVRNQLKPVPSKAEIHAEFGVPVTLGKMTRGSIDQKIDVVGDLAALSTVTLSSKVQGKVVYVAGRPGDPVSKGQVVIRLDPADAISQVKQAEAGLRSAKARLSQAITALKVQQTQSSAMIEQAKAQLASAESQLDIVKKPARSQQEAIAESQVASAKAALRTAESSLNRVKILFKQGAISEQQLDVAQAEYDVAKSAYESAQQNLSLVKEGSRAEEIRSAEQAVKQARENLRMAIANASQVEMRREDVRSAEAGVAQAQANLDYARQQLAYCTLTAPESGIISKRMVEPGETANPGVPLINIVDLRTVYFEAQISEKVLKKINPNQSVDVRVDAFPEKVFSGKVAAIFPTASSKSRNIAVRITLPNPNGELRPGMFARGAVNVGSIQNALLAPAEAVEERYGEKIIFTVRNRKAVLHKIDTGASTDRVVQVIEPATVSEGDLVVLTGHQNLNDKTPVTFGKQREKVIDKLLDDRKIR